MIIITGAAGFIGSCVLAFFNRQGVRDVLAVDHLNHPLKEANLAGKHYERYFEKDVFLKLLCRDDLPEDVETVIHMGACSSTTLQDEMYYRENNFEYSRYIARWCLKHDVPLIYASSAATYGDGSAGYSDDNETTRRLSPLNLYGRSKHDFDLWVLDERLDREFVGLKFFNVYGPNEYHKGEMRSVVCKAYPDAAHKGRMRLFQSCHADYDDGEQKRDFIYVKDAVDIVFYFHAQRNVKGIYNVGTGKARSWNDVAKALFSALDKPAVIEYIPMPEHLKGRYQYFTQAQMGKLRSAGYGKAFTELEDGIADYAGFLKDNRHL